MTTPRQTKRKGFTLMELLVSMSIMFVLVGIGLPAYTGAMEAALTTRLIQQARGIHTASYAYATMNEGYYPGTLTPDQAAAGIQSLGTSTEVFDDLFQSGFVDRETAFMGRLSTPATFNQRVEQGENQWDIVTGAQTTHSGMLPLICSHDPGLAAFDATYNAGEITGATPVSLTGTGADSMFRAERGCIIIRNDGSGGFAKAIGADNQVILIPAGQNTHTATLALDVLEP